MRSLFVRIFLSFWATIAIVTMVGHVADGLLMRVAVFRYLDRFDTGIPELVVAIALSAMPCWLLARSLSRPIVELCGAVRELGQGDLGARADGTVRRRRDEIGQLAGDFDEMAGRLEALVNAQNRLVGDISHELRSPLGRMGLALELARRQSGAGAAGALDRAEREIRRLDEMLGRLLVLSRLEGGGEGVQRVRVHLEELVGEVIADANFEAHSRDRSVVGVEMERCTTLGDPDLLRSAVENVVRNAVRHTRAGTEVEVTLRMEGEGDGSAARIEVRDHGPGLAEEELAEIFRPFYRVDSARGRQDGGTGLGLAITRGALGLHGGSVAAFNAAEGGLVVRMTIPAVSREAGGGVGGDGMAQ